MKALKKLQQGPGHMEIVDVPRTDPGPQDVEVRIVRTAICGTDLHILAGRHSILEPPVIVGHEAAGVVERMGADVTTLRLGDRVSLETTVEVCGKCRYCLTGASRMCPHRRGLGVHRDGTFAEYCTVPASILHPLADDVSFGAGALSNAFSTALRAAVDRAHVQPKDVVLVMGAGGIGLAVAEICCQAGATAIVSGLERDADRLEVAKRLGVAATVNVDREDTRSVINARTDGYGVDVVFECSGAAAAIELGLSCLRKQGVFVQVGLPSAPVPVDFAQLCHREISIIGSIGHDGNEMERTNAMFAKQQLDADALVTHEYPLEQWEAAFEAMRSGAGIRVLMKPSEDA